MSILKQLALLHDLIRAARAVVNYTYHPDADPGHKNWFVLTERLKHLVEACEE